MKGVYQSSEELADRLTAAGFNKITFGDLSEVDLNKQNLYPLAHIVLNSLSVTSRTTDITYTVVVMDLLDVNTLDPLAETTPFQRTDNLEDVYHDLAARANEAIQYYFRSPSVSRLNSDEVTMEAFMYEYENTLAGFTFDLQVTVVNNEEGIC